MKLLVTGGGTGGHVSPGLAVAKVWEERHGKGSAIWAGRKGGIEERMALAAGLEFRDVPSRAFRRSLDPRNLGVPLELARGLVAAVRLLKREAPSAVLMTGGYAGFPTALAAALGGTPLVLLELDASPGLANRLLSGGADAVCLAQKVRDKRSHGVHTGNPVRFSPRLPAKAAAREKLGLKAEGEAALVIPGSQAAHSVNAALIEGLKELKGLQLLWMTGPADFDEVSAAVKKARAEAVVTPFIEDVAAAYAACDLVLARSGASMLAEIALAGKPSLLVPYPHAARDHQRHNARAFAGHGAARVLEDSELGGGRLGRELRALLLDKEGRRRMAEAAKKLARPKAAEDVAGVLERVARGFKYV